MRIRIKCATVVAVAAMLAAGAASAAGAPDNRSDAVRAANSEVAPAIERDARELKDKAKRALKRAGKALRRDAAQVRPRTESRSRDDGN